MNQIDIDHALAFFCLSFEILSIPGRLADLVVQFGGIESYKKNPFVAKTPILRFEKDPTDCT